MTDPEKPSAKMNDPQKPTDPPATPVSRRSVLKAGAVAAGLVGVGAAGIILSQRARTDGLVWQIDPEKCIQCGQCATYCVLRPSAVKCVQAYSICGYCELCFAYAPPGFEPDPGAQSPGAEAQLCPTGAILRKWVEGTHYEYSIDESLCIGCGKCIKGCNKFGNGSLFLQTRHNRCLNCDECSIAVACPSDAFRRIPATDPYLLKGKDHKA
jgi:Na+-translocating ferredoxin:NAD+ oxidoreductase subunit B